MSVILKKRPPGYKGEPMFVDGGLALYHYLCDTYVAFTVEELTPIPELLLCPNCGIEARTGFIADDLERVLAGIRP